MKKLSIIIPVYQVKQYLDRCLKSILSQTFTDYEVILVDDGSTDGSQDICDDYAKKYSVVSAIHKKNGGLSSARNTGIEAASGEYLMFVDSDDMIHSKAAEIGIDLLEEHNAEALICPLKRFSSEEEVNVNTLLDKLEGVAVISGLEAEKGFFNNPNANMFVSSCGKVFKRTLFEGIRFPEGRLFEDEYITYKLYYRCKKVVIINDELYFYFINPFGITQNLNLDKKFDEYDAQKERINFFRIKGHTELYHLALLEFLRTAQWDLINVQLGEQVHNNEKGNAFQKEYAGFLRRAKEEKIVTFSKNFDFYIIAFPHRKRLYQLKRLVLKTLGLIK